MLQYLQLLRHVRENGTYKEDRTGVGTYSVFGAQLRFDLSEGFPAVTTKKLFFKGVVAELLWFLSGDTNLDFLHENNVHIWDAWADPSGYLQDIYGKQWRRLETLGEDVGLVEVRTARQFVPKRRELMSVDYENSDDYVGKRFKNKDGDEYIVLKRVGVSGNSKYLVQFLETKSLKEVTRPNIRNGHCKDPNKPIVCGVGYIGERLSGAKYDRRLYSMWRSMLARCYNKNNPSYAKYGAKGITVNSEWHSFSDFERTIKNVPFYENWKKNPSGYHLDKDYFGSNQYSKDTTIFLRAGDNIGLSSQNGVAFRIDNKLFVSQCELAGYLGIHSQRVSDWLNHGRKPEYFSGVEVLFPPEGFNYRKIRVVDQLRRVIEAIKNDPNSRRHLVDAWTVAEVDGMSLPPCHYSYCFNVTNGKLSCMWFQRSVDVMLGLPFNIASYALLTHLVARECGLGVGELIFSGGDTHIYSNHLEQVDEQLSREPKTLPTLWLNPERKRVDDFGVCDVRLENYECWPAIRAPIAV